jgi:hypothetical protein
VRAIKIEFSDTHTFAKPLNFGQLEEFEQLLKEIGAESNQITTDGGAAGIPLDLLRKQLQIVKAAIQTYDPEFNREKEFTIQEIATAFTAVVSGSGLEEVPEGEGQPGASIGVSSTPS